MIFRHYWVSAWSEGDYASRRFWTLGGARRFRERWRKRNAHTYLFRAYAGEWEEFA